MNQATENGKHVIFLVSQPRSGSTLLQKMLGAHPAIHTTSEPWLMLPPAYTLRDDGIEATYEWKYARMGLQTFLDGLPKGREDYLQGLRRMYGYLYRRALSDTDAGLFLDKTPRYYQILPELREIFPKARFILLFRNPIAVLSSIIRTWVGSDWLYLAKHRRDILDAPDLLLRAKGHFENTKSLRYEDLVQQPAREMKRLFRFIDVDFDPSVVNYGDEEHADWALGDPGSVYQHEKPQTSSLRKWTQTESAQEWHLLSEYADFLGAETFEKLGYDYESCIEILERNRPPRRAERLTVSLEWLLEKCSGSERRWRNQVVRILESMREHGLLGLPSYLLRRLRSRFGG